MSWTIEFYKTKNGKVPVREFLDSLKPRQAANVIEAIYSKKKNEGVLKWMIWKNI